MLLDLMTELTPPNTGSNGSANSLPSTPPNADGDNESSSHSDAGTERLRDGQVDIQQAGQRERSDVAVADNVLPAAVHSFEKSRLSAVECLLEPGTEQENESSLLDGSDVQKDPHGDQHASKTGEIMAAELDDSKPMSPFDNQDAMPHVPPAASPSPPAAAPSAPPVSKSGCPVAWVSTILPALIHQGQSARASSV